MPDAIRKKPYRAHLFICQGKDCTERSAKGASPNDAKKYFKQFIEDAGLKGEVRACTSSCLDRCDHGPNMVVYPEATWYSSVTPTEWPAIRDHLLGKARKER